MDFSHKTCFCLHPTKKKSIDVRSRKHGGHSMQPAFQTNALERVDEDTLLLSVCVMWRCSILLEVQFIKVSFRSELWYYHTMKNFQIIISSNRKCLHQAFPQRWIGRWVGIEWPSRSPDLTSINSLVGCSKEQVIWEKSTHSE